MQESEKQEPGWAFKQEAGPAPAGSAQSKSPTHQEVRWTASEFIDHHKSFGWYLALAGFLVVLAGLIYLFTKDLISVVAIFVVGVLFGIIAGRKPRELPYSVDSHGIKIADKFYPYALFKSFAVAQEGVIGCVNLLPLKRFMPELSIYFPPEEGPKILDILAESLPNEQRKELGVDKLMRQLRF